MVLHFATLPQQGDKKRPAGGKSTLKGRVISSFRRRPESRTFLNYLIFKAKHWTPAFAGVTAQRIFYCKAGISIIFQHPANSAQRIR
jgi:hypothetical protein